MAQRAWQSYTFDKLGQGMQRRPCQKQTNLAAHDGKRQLMAPRGQFMTENDDS